MVHDSTDPCRTGWYVITQLMLSLEITDIFTTIILVITCSDTMHDHAWSCEHRRQCTDMLDTCMTAACKGKRSETSSGAQHENPNAGLTCRHGKGTPWAYVVGPEAADSHRSASQGKRCMKMKKGNATVD